MRQGNGRTGAVVDDNPRPTTHSEPLMKSSTSEDDLSNRNSTASTSFSDRSSFTPTETSSPFAMSPWNTTNSPWSQSSDTSLFPPGTGLVGSLVREEGHIYSLAAASGLLYTGSDSKNIRVWKNQREFSGFKATSGLVKAIVVSPFDRKVFTGHQDGKIRVWRPSPKSPAVHKRIGTLPRLKDLIKNLGRRRNPSNSIRHSDAVSCLSLSDDGSIIYSGSWDRTIKVWRVADSRCVESIMAHDDAVNCIVVVEGLMLSGSADGTVKAWRREAGTTRHTGVQTLLKQESAVTAMAAMKRAGVVYCGSSDGAINFWEQLGHRGVLKGHEGAVMCLAAAGEGMLFSGGVDRTIRVWRRDAGSGAHACASVMTGHAGPVKCLAVAAEAGVWVVYSGSLDKSVKVWKVADPDATDGDRSTAPPVAYHGAPRVSWTS